MSAVLAREGDRWTVVHSHASFGVPNADVFS
jgi:ketosteroid isomerase-like protein